MADVRLAVSEAVTNVVVHSYRHEPDPGPVEVAAAIRGTELHVTVVDHGQGYAPRHDSPGIGMGLPLIATVADGFELCARSPRGTELRMCFTL